MVHSGVSRMVEWFKNKIVIQFLEMKRGLKTTVIEKNLFLGCLFNNR